MLVESPTYLGALNAMELSAPEYVAVPTDENGMLPGELEKILKERDNVKMIYVIPDFQNPSGITWSLERRKAFIDVVSKYDIPVVEDAPYAELRYDGEKLPALKSLDKKGQVVFLGSFSKIMMPGLRVGWLVAAPEIFTKLLMIKQRVDLQSGTFAQYQVSYYMDMYDLDAHIEKIKALYRTRRDALCDAIEKFFPEGTLVNRPEGGLFVWVTLPENVDMQALVPMMVENNIAYVHGSPFYPGGGNNNHCRLNFSSMPEERLVSGIRLMGKLLKENM